VTVEQLEPGLAYKLVALEFVIAIFTKARVTASFESPSDGSSFGPIDQKRLQSIAPHCIVDLPDCFIPFWVFVVACSERLLQGPSLFPHILSHAPLHKSLSCRCRAVEWAMLLSLGQVVDFHCVIYLL